MEAIVSKDDSAYGKALEVMDRAFHADPTARWYHAEKPELFATEHQRYVGLCARAALENGRVYATPTFDGAAIWYGPGGGVDDTAYNAFKNSVFFQIVWID
ncbi:MAG: hypothetical protein ACU0BB_04855 [Paracoccaceae bacterium]